MSVLNGSTIINPPIVHGNQIISRCRSYRVTAIPVICSCANRFFRSASMLIVSSLPILTLTSANSSQFWPSSIRAHLVQTVLPLDSHFFRIVLPESATSRESSR